MEKAEPVRPSISLDESIEHQLQSFMQQLAASHRQQADTPAASAELTVELHHVYETNSAYFIDAMFRFARTTPSLRFWLSEHEVDDTTIATMHVLPQNG